MKHIPNNIIALIGIGNEGRRDDGLGWAFVDAVTQAGFGGDALYRYQLQVEDAELISGYQAVIFADATSESLSDGWHYAELTSAGHMEWTTHRMSPEAVLSVCETLYGKRPRTWLLAIEGRQWGLQTGLSPEASAHLKGALKAWPNVRAEVLKSLPT